MSPSTLRSTGNCKNRFIRNGIVFLHPNIYQFTDPLQGCIKTYKYIHMYRYRVYKKKERIFFNGRYKTVQYNRDNWNLQRFYRTNLILSFKNLNRLYGDD